MRACVCRLARVKIAGVVVVVFVGSRDVEDNNNNDDPRGRERDEREAIRLFESRRDKIHEKESKTSFKSSTPRESESRESLLGKRRDSEHIYHEKEKGRKILMMEKAAAVLLAEAGAVPTGWLHRFSTPRLKRDYLM